MKLEAFLGINEVFEGKPIFEIDWELAMDAKYLRDIGYDRVMPITITVPDAAEGTAQEAENEPR